MENKKMNIKTIIIILLIAVIISLVFVILNMKNSNIAQQEVIKEQLGETTGDNTYVGMQSHLSEINEQEEKLVSFKSAIATAITNKGVQTAADADEDTMVENIGSIKSNNAFTIPTLNLGWGCNASSWFGGFSNTNLTFNTDGYTTLSISSVSISKSNATGIDYNTLPTVSIKSGNTTIKTLSNGNNNITLDISNYSTITIYVNGNPAAGQRVILNTVIFK